MDWVDLPEVQGTLKSLLQHNSLKASILWCSAFFMVQLSQPYVTAGRTSEFFLCLLGAPWHLPSPTLAHLDKVLGSMEPPRGPPANGAEPSRSVGTVKVYLPNKQRTVVSLMGAKLAGGGHGSCCKSGIRNVTRVKPSLQSPNRYHGVSLRTKELERAMLHPVFHPHSRL